MALTQEERERMDRITGGNYFATLSEPQKTNNKSNNTTLSDKDIADMDRIVGYKPEEADLLKEEIKAKNPDEVKMWEEKGAISPFNAALNASREFDGTYNNIDNNVNYNWFENWLKNSEWSKSRSQSVDERIQNNIDNNAQRDERINSGSANIVDKVSKLSKNVGDKYIEGRVEKNVLNEKAQGINRQDKTTRYEISGMSKDGTPIYREIDLLKQIGFIEGMRKRLSANVPIIGAFAEGADIQKHNEIKNKILEGEAIRQDELDFLNATEARKKEEYIRDYSNLGLMGTSVVNSLGLVPEFMAGSALFKVLRGGVLAKNIGINTYRTMRGANIGKKIARIGGKVANVATTSVLEPLAYTVVNPQRTYHFYQERMLGNEMKLTDRGTYIFHESGEKPATAFIKSLLTTYIMAFTEMAGGKILGAATGGIIKGAAGVGATTTNKLIQKNPKLGSFLEKTTKELSKRYEQLKDLPVVGKSTGWIRDKAHFDGFLEEMGEEALEDVLRLTFGIDNEERSLENYAKAVFKSPEEWAVIAGAIAIQGAGLSATSYVLGNRMAENGSPKEDIIEVLNNTSEAQKLNIIQKLMEDKNIDIEDSVRIKEENVISGLKQNFLENNTFKTEKEAERAANVFVTGLSKISDVTGMSMDDLLKEEMATIRNQSTGVNEPSALSDEEIDTRMSELTDYFDNMTDENFNEEEFNAYEKEYNELEKLKERKVLNQTSIETAGAEKGQEQEAAREWQEKKEDSKFFKNWFGDSKVVDEDGKPLVVYHGTNAEFDEFDNKRGEWYGFIFFSKEKDTIRAKFSKYNMPVYLKIKNPYYTDYFSYANVTPKTRQELIEKGYDGIIAKKENVCVVFEPEQIKSVNNQGTFDSENPNIYHQGKKTEPVSISTLVDNNIQSRGYELINGSDNSITNNKNNVKYDIPTDNSGNSIKLKKSGKISINMAKAMAQGFYPEEQVRITLSAATKDGKKLKKLYEENKKYKQNYRVNYIDPSSNVYNQETGEMDSGKPMFFDTKEEAEKFAKTVSNPKIKLVDEWHHISGGGRNKLVDINYLKSIGFNIDTSTANKEFKLNENPDVYYQSVYHGTPHNFDEFSAENIGSGEGVQAHGWGLYFAGNKEVSERYRKWLTDNYSIRYDGKPYVKNGANDIFWTDLLKELYENPQIKEEKLAKAYENKKIFDKIISDLTARAKNATGNEKKKLQEAIAYHKGGAYKQIKDKIDFYENIDTSKITMADNNGQLFEVDIPEDDVMLDEDALLDEQPEKVQEAIKELYKEVPYLEDMFENNLDTNPTGRDLYRGLTQEYEPKEASELLNKHGIKGIKYDGQKDGTCYVVFDDKAIKIIEKYYQIGIGQKIDVIKSIFKGKTIKDLCESDSFFKVFQDELQDVGDYIVDKMPKSFKGSKANGKNIQNGKVIYLNMDNIGDDIYKLAKTFRHEVEHAKQHKKYKEIVNKKQKTQQDLDYINKYEACKKANAEKQAYYNKHGKILKEILAKTKGLSKNELAKYIKKLDTKTLKIYNEYVSIYNNYLNTPFEVEARQAGQKGVERIKEYERSQIERNGFGSSGIRGEWDVRTGSQYGSSFKQEIRRENEEDIRRNTAQKIEEIKGAYTPAKNLIELFKNADESTIVHEFAHWWLDRLNKYSKDNEELALDMEAVRKFVGNEGEDFTHAQHEKFARGFEAYIRSGYAKTNRLKKIFEDFKNALLSIYDSIKQLGFNEDEIPQIQGLFDRLLTTERERIKATVFDKVSEIDEKIENIKGNESKELEELDNLYKENLKYLNRKSDKNRKAKEYLDLAEKMTTRESKEVKDFKKRYKEATLQILETATGYNRQFIANPKNREKVQTSLEHSDDKITVSGGMRQEWEEFYTDTGVNYENDEIDGDYKLAEQAFKVMSEGSYNKTYRENYSFDDIAKFEAKFNYLADKVENLKGEEKEIAFKALSSLFDDMPSMPDEVTSNIVNKLSEIEGEKEEQQKNDFNKKYIPSVNFVSQLQNVIVQKLKSSNIYNYEKRYNSKMSKSHRLYRYIKDIKSVDGAKKQIKRINEFIIDDLRNSQRKLLSNEIQKQIKINSKVVKVGTLKKGKFDWKTNTVFSELVVLNKMAREEAEKELGMLVQIQKVALGEARDSFDENEIGEFNKTNDFQANLKNKFLQYRSQRTQELDVTHTMQLLQDILELKEKGRQAKSEKEFVERTQRWNTKNDLLDILDVVKSTGSRFGANWIAGVGGIGNVASLNGGTLANWESLLNAIFNKNTAEQYSLLLDEAKTEVYARKNMLHFYQKAFEIYGFKNPNGWDKFLDYDYMQPLIKLMQEYNDETKDFTQSVFSINSPDGIARSSIKISRAQMITMYAWSLNENLEERLITQFGEEQLTDMFDNILSTEDKALAWALVDTCEGMREDINDVFIRTTGLSLPMVENYFPSKAERVQSDIDMYHDFVVKSSNPSFIKDRKTCSRIPMKPMAPLEILIPHINKAARYVVMSEKVNYLNKIFKDVAIKTKMQEIWGSDSGAKIYQTLINKLAACTFTNYSKGTNLVAGWLDTLSRNYITSRIGFSLKVATGQLLSMVNYAENMPTGEWGKRWTATMAHPVENFNYMLDNCEYLKNRLSGNTQSEIIAILTSEKDKFRTLRNFMTSNVKWGDIIAITLGGKPYVDYLMEQGMSKEEAFDKFIEQTLRSQQAGTTSSISEWQSAQAKNCLSRMFFAFRNTDMQYERKLWDTIIQAKKGDISKSEAAKKIFIYKVLNPFLFLSCVQNMSILAAISAIFRGDDPEDIVGDFVKNAILAILLSGLGAYGIAGLVAIIVVESIIALLDDEYKHFETKTPVLSDIDYIFRKYSKGDLELEDYIDALATGSELAVGVPSSKVVNAAEGVGDIYNGEYGVGLSRMAGWGKYTATKAWTGKKPKK